MHEPDNQRPDAETSRAAPSTRAEATACPGPFELPDLTRVLLDSMTEGVSLAAEDGTIRYTNPAEDRMFGYAPGELVGQHVSVQNGYPPEENARIVEEVIAELKRSGAWTGEWLNRRKDGTTFITTSRISSVLIQGRPHWLCVQDDVTERTRAAANLRESRARLDLATNAAALGIWDWDLESGRMTYSARAKAICGFAPDQEVTFSDAQRVTHPEDYPRTSAMAHRALDPELRERIPYEYRIIQPDGAVRWVLAHGEAVFDDVAGQTRAVRYVGTLQDVTDRKRLEDEDRASKARLALAIEAGQMAVWEIDLLTDHVTGSPELNRVLGFPVEARPSAEEMRARYYPGERERLEALGREALARGEKTIDAEYRYLWPDGSVRWLWLRAEIVLDPAGTPTSAVGVVMDVTDRRRAEEAQRASEARLKLAQQAAGIGVWDWDVETGTVTWSPEIYAILGLDPERDAGDPFAAWLAALHPDDRKAANDTAQRAASHGEPFDMEFRVVPRSGDLRWVRSHGVAVLDGSGRPCRVVGVNVDVTEERRREEGLRALAGNLQSAVEASAKERERIYELSNDLFAVAGFDGYLKTINPAWARLLGYSVEQLLSQPFATIIHPDDHAAAARVISSMQAGETLQRFEDRLLKADGGMVWVAWAAVPEGDRFYAVGRDVTRDKERDDALRQAQKMEAVGQLTGGIAHDFNNLLGAVVGSLDLIHRKPTDIERVRRYAEAGLRAAERGAKLTGQLLAFSRAQRIEQKPVLLSELVDGMRDMLDRAIGPLVRVSVSLGCTGAVLSDPTQLEMAVLNLAINARDAMPNGGDLTITTSTRCIEHDPELDPGEYQEIAVSDTGMGMPPEVVARAFDPFFTTKGVGKGTGLGLSQVYGVARQTGGTVRIESQPGEGTTVRILLPSTSAPVRLALEPHASRESGAEFAATILVVDDDPDVRRVLVDLMDALGYHVVEAEDGRSGMAALESSSPDLMIIDFAMPGMNGAEVARLARGHRPDLPIVFASGYADTAAIEDVAGPAAVILRKPFRLSDLQAVLAEALGPSTRC